MSESADLKPVPSFYYNGRQRVHLTSTPDLFCVFSTEVAILMFGMERAVEMASSGEVEDLLFLSSSDLSPDEMEKLIEANALLPVFTYDQDGLIVVCTDKVCVSARSAGQETVLKYIQDTPILGLEEVTRDDDLMVLRVTSGDGAEALRICNGLQEATGISVCPSFLRIY
ncbi:hypothetical protein KBD61_00790 [Patescibacteria group bacterium]|nr:hypothetical protein [Patescibacteria group bacterium]